MFKGQGLGKMNYYNNLFSILDRLRFLIPCRKQKNIWRWRLCSIDWI